MYDVTVDQPQAPKPKRQWPRRLVVAFVVLALVAAAAYGGWWYGRDQERKKYEQLNAQQKTEPVEEAAEVTYKTATIDAGKELTLSYPSGWTVEKEEHLTDRASGDDPALKNETTENATFTSPSGEVTVVVNSGGGGIGGACLPEESSTFTTVKVDAVKNAAGYKLLTTASKDNRYNIAIVKTEDAVKAKVGGSVCDVAFSMFLLPSDIPQGVLMLRVQSPKLDEKIDKGAASQAEINEFLTKKEVAEAKAILTSLKIAN